jgi:hypothetical protein
MSQEQDNSAFPLHMHGDYGKGMTLRDYFAAATLQGFLANSSNEFVMLPHVNLASEAYMVADAMLAARKEAQP